MELTKTDIAAILSDLNQAAAAILDIYRSADLEVEIKKDNSPLTLADKTSHQIITSSLKKLYPDIPVISEEAKLAPYKVRKNWHYFWLLDPLDGTKEFISKNGEFTINLALIRGSQPIFGAILAPVEKVIYFAQKDRGAYVKKAGSTPKLLRARTESRKTIVVARTRSHKNKKEEPIISKLGRIKVISAGSALKFCLVAQARADIYLRGGPTMEWDTAAGQCIAAESGAKTFCLDGQPFLYNKESLLNPGLICTANQELIKKIGFYGKK